MKFKTVLLQITLLALLLGTSLINVVAKETPKQNKSENAKAQNSTKQSQHDYKTIYKHVHEIIKAEKEDYPFFRWPVNSTLYYSPFLFEKYEHEKVLDQKFQLMSQLTGLKFKKSRGEEIQIAVVLLGNNMKKDLSSKIFKQYTSIFKEDYEEFKKEVLASMKKEDTILSIYPSGKGRLNGKVFSRYQFVLIIARNETISTENFEQLLLGVAFDAALETTTSRNIRESITHPRKVKNRLKVLTNFDEALLEAVYSPELPEV
ncbi:MAG: hypothetical protein GY786_12550, partial [Proteobacteria bacterium]|nr:hypothetical protein [Pseudomonadota bacterium]